MIDGFVNILLSGFFYLSVLFQIASCVGSLAPVKMASKGKVQHKPHTSISKVKKICCRVDTCKEEILIQNYERHLQRFHPSENKYDKRVFGEKKNFFETAIFQSQEKTNSSNVEITDSQGPPTVEEDINENIKSVQEFDQSTSAKRG